MRKYSLMVGLLVAAALIWTANAYAGDGSAWTDFWNGVGGFIYNAMPWNWGNWAGK